MRAALYQYLTENCQSIKSWHQPGGPDKDTQKPYGVIKLGEETRAPFNNRGFFRELTIWPYFKVGSFIPADQAVAELKGLLAGTILTTSEGHKFEIEWVHTGGDFQDPDLDAITRRIEFRIPRVGR